MRRCLLRVLAPALPLFVLATVARAQDEVRSGQRVSLVGAHVEIFDAVGRVTLRRGTGNGVGITATATGPDAGQLHFFTDRDGDLAVFRVQFPDVEDIAAPEGLGEGGRTTLRLRRDGTFGGDSDGWGRRDRRGGEVEIGGRGGLRGWANLEITVPQGARGTVHLAVGRADINGVDGTVTIDTWGANATAQNIAGEWLFDTGSGDVEVRGARGSLRIDTGSGSGTVTGMRGDLLDIDTGSGDVDVTDTQVARCRFDTGSGDVRATGLTAPRCVADTGSGSVRLDYAGGAVDDLLIDTGAGSVTITLPPNPSVRLNVDTGSGGVNVMREGGLFERRDEDGMVLRFGEGRGRVRIDTGSGGVTIR